jgi:hypothetical protein
MPFAEFNETMRWLASLATFTKVNMPPACSGLLGAIRPWQTCPSLPERGEKKE